MPVIRLVDLQKTYRSGLFGRKEVQAVRGVSFQVEAGELFGILGPNGAGKTTIIKILMGLISASSGIAEVFGHPAGSQRTRLKLGYLPEHHRFPPYLTGNEALDYYGRLSGMSGAEIKARRGPVLERVGMSSWGETKLRDYSKGMRQRVGIAQALIHDPEIIFLDEPTDGVDPVGRTEIRGILQGLAREGKTVFINSHLLQEVELLCNRVTILSYGEVLRTGTVKELTSGQDQLTVRIDRALGSQRDKIVELVGEPEHESPSSDGEGFEFELAGLEPGKVDALVDVLRSEGISIRALIPHRATLEEAFLEVVGGRQVGAQQESKAATSAPVKATKVVKARRVETED